MKKKIIEAAVWAFAQSGQYESALDAALKLAPKYEDLDKILKQLLKYYLKEIDLLNRQTFNMPAQRSDAWTAILKYLKAAYKAATMINNPGQRYDCRKEVVMKGLEYIQKSNASIEELVGFLYEAQAGAYSNDFTKKVIKIYLGIPHLRGEEILKITELMCGTERFVEVGKLVPIFIKRGDYEALRLIREKYGKLGDEIVSQSEQIILSCLDRGKIKDAAGAVSLIPDKEKRQEYYMLLGVDFRANSSDVSDAEEKIN